MEYTKSNANELLSVFDSRKTSYSMRMSSLLYGNDASVTALAPFTLLLNNVNYGYS